MALCLGKKPPAPIKLKLKNYLGPNLPPPPAHCDWTLAVSEPWGMMGNDQFGCCCYSSKGHIIATTSANGDGIVVPTTEQVLAAYSQATGFDPKDAANTDNGDTIAHSNQYMVNVGMCGQTSDGYAAVDHKDQHGMMESIALFGALDVGVQLPKSAMDSAGQGGVWSDITDTNILGGHCVPVFAYDKDEVLLVTWGAVQRATWQWILNYTDEACAPVYAAWVSGTIDTSPSGFNYQQLMEDLQSL